TLIGGNLCTLNLLQGTEYYPGTENAILLIEDDDMSDIHMFDRDLQSLIHLPAFSHVKGILIGRFQKASNVSIEHVKAMI
ncbi:LD-carboxypeptidase, partial [Bacillus spizizenii]|nr:LD-carboxypeptidase [Bacillus spizizenii]